MNDTIAAISTALGASAISIIRLSGDQAINIINKIFKGKDLKKAETHTINYGHILDKEVIIDEVLVSIMKAPKTFTKEDVVEVNCHGGIATTNKILELILSNGARLAEPGEFTKRAFLNGRIDMLEAEGIMDLINSKTEKAMKLAINQVDGNLSKLIRSLRGEIVKILANIEVNIDYPEYEDILVLTNNMIKKNMQTIELKIKNILTLSKNSKIIKEGIKAVILGRPNVGKSSLLNRLINEDKAIVTDIEGTTRDIVEGSTNLDGILLNLIDTAGIRETSNIIEKMGVDKSIKLIDEADLLILVLNNNEEIKKEDVALLEKTKNQKLIIFINKIDLKSRLDRSKIFGDIVEGSTITDNGLTTLKEKIKELFCFDQLEKGDFTYLSNARQISIMNNILLVVDDIKKALAGNVPIDLVEIDLKKVWSLLGEIVGDNYNDELLDNLFKQFCIGK